MNCCILITTLTLLTPSPLPPIFPTISQPSLKSEGGELHIIVQDTSSSRKQSSLLEVDLINIGPRASKSLLLHVRGQQTRWSEADVLRDNSLALALAGQSKSASDGHTGHGLLRRGNAAKVEALQREVRSLAAGGLESCRAVETGTENVLDCDVGLGLRENAGGCDADVDDVEAVPGQALVGADGLERCYWKNDRDVVELDGLSATGYHALNA